MTRKNTRIQTKKRFAERRFYHKRTIIGNIVKITKNQIVGLPGISIEKQSQEQVKHEQNLESNREIITQNQVFKNFLSVPDPKENREWQNRLALTGDDFKIILEREMIRAPEINNKTTLHDKIKEVFREKLKKIVQDKLYTYLETTDSHLELQDSRIIASANLFIDWLNFNTPNNAKLEFEILDPNILSKINQIWELFENKNVVTCNKSDFKHAIETANLKILIKDNNKSIIQDTTYRLKYVMGDKWYTKTCETMEWKKQICTSRTIAYHIEKELDRIVPKPKANK